MMNLFKSGVGKNLRISFHQPDYDSNDFHIEKRWKCMKRGTRLYFPYWNITVTKPGDDPRATPPNLSKERLVGIDFVTPRRAGWFGKTSTESERPATTTPSNERENKGIRNPDDTRLDDTAKRIAPGGSLRRRVAIQIAQRPSEGKGIRYCLLS